MIYTAAHTTHFNNFYYIIINFIVTIININMKKVFIEPLVLLKYLFLNL